MPISVQSGNNITAISLSVLSPSSQVSTIHMTSGLVASQVSLSSSIFGNGLRALKYRKLGLESLVALYFELLPCSMLPPGFVVPKKNFVLERHQGWNGEVFG